jgi:hypothetical protein
LHVDALVTWFIDLAASHMKLRRFGRRHKGGPGDCATAANSREQAQKKHPGAAVANWTNKKIRLLRDPHAALQRGCGQ